MQGSEEERRTDDAGGDAAAMAGITERFKAAHPAKWEAIRLCATQHGIDEMIECLRY